LEVRRTPSANLTSYPWISLATLRVFVEISTPALIDRVLTAVACLHQLAQDDSSDQLQNDSFIFPAMD
jgi:hypothetical protein